jgi:hypothetical protein
MTTEQQIEVFTAIAGHFPEGRVAIPAEQTLSTTRDNLSRDLGDLPEDAKLISQGITGETIIVKYWVN